MNDTIIQRTYNRWGDRMYLIRMDPWSHGWVPVWCCDKRQAVRVTASYAADLLHHIALYRDHLCPDGIKGVEAVCVA